MTPLRTLYHSARRRLGGRPAPSHPDTPERRAFLQRAGALGAATLGAGLLAPDEAWAASEAAARELGIVPGTVVDAQGRLIRETPTSADPYLGEIMAVGWNFAARGWALCDGQLFPISQYSALYSLLGTIYGGDGRTTFALPDLRGRHAIGFGQGSGLQPYNQGSVGGVETVTLSVAQIPSHTHTQPVSDAPGTSLEPNGLAPAVDSSGNRIYGPPVAPNTFEPTTATGGGQSHENRPPYLALYCQIATQGVYPSRS